MPQKYKIDNVSNLTERFDGAKAIHLLDYKGINIAEVTELRRRLRAVGVDYFVAKNTLIQIALHSHGIQELDKWLCGPTAVAVCKTDEVATSKAIFKFKKEVMEEKAFPSFKIALIGGNLFDASQLEQLSKLPSREELIARLMGSMKAPITGVVGVMSGILRKFVYAVDAIAKKQAEQN